MGSDSRDPALIQYHYPVRIHYAGYPLGDDELRHAGKGFPEALSYGGVRSGIHSGSGIVKYQYLRLSQYGPCYAEPLFLSSGEVGASLFYMGFISVMEFLYEFSSAGYAAGFRAFLFRGKLISPSQVFKYGSGKELILLQYMGYAFP